MKKFWLKFLIVTLGIGMLCPTWLVGGIQKVSAASFIHEYYKGEADTTYTEKTSSNWTNSGFLSGGRWTDDAGEWAKWEFTPDVSGDYKVSTKWVINSSQTDDADYIVTDKNGINPPINVNQRKDADGITSQPNNTVSSYKNIGTYQFQAGSSYSVKVIGDISASKHLFAGWVKIGHENVIPTTPLLASPSDSSVIDDKTPTFSWGVSNDLDDATPLEYELFVSDTSDFSNLVINKSGLESLTDTFYTPSVDLGYQKYYWQVRAFDGEGYSVKSTTFSFTVSSIVIPETPTNLIATPGNGEVSLSWDAVAGVDHYNVYYQKFSNTSYFGPIPVTQTSTKIINLENGVLYRFIVRSVNLDGVESENAWIEATPVAPVSVVTSTVVIVSAPTVQEPVTPLVISQVPQTDTDVQAPNTTEPEVGKIKGEEQKSTDEEKINWTPWIILFILIILAGAATGGYFYWFGRDEEEEIVSEEVLAKNDKPKKNGAKSAPVKKNSKRW